MRGQRGIERVRREEEWQSVFVPGPNEPSNAMNRLFTMVWLVQSELVMCHWQDITQLCLPGLRCSCQYARFASRPPYHTRFHCINTITSSLYLSFLFFSTGPTHTHLLFFLITGAHIQANEKWQLCTLFAIQHLPRPPVSQKEGELHSLTPMSPLMLFSCCISHIDYFFMI